MRACACDICGMQYALVKSITQDSDIIQMGKNLLESANYADCQN